MAEAVELAKEGIEHAHHATHEGHEEHGSHGKRHSDKFPRRVAVLVAVLAACLALAELGEKKAQNEYLAEHITVSDTWNFYQAKNIRRTVYSSTADAIESMAATDPSAPKRVKDLRDQAQRMLDDPKSNEGTKQLLETAKRHEAIRDEHLEAYHHFELGSGVLQICIVLASVSVITRSMWLAWAGGVLGLGAAVWTGLVFAGMV